MTEVPGTPSANGATHEVGSRESMLAQMRQRASGLSERRAELRLAIVEIDTELKAWEKAIAALDPTPPAPKLGRPASSKPGANPSRVGPERMATIEQAIREIATEQPSGEVRQADVAHRTGLSSAVMASAFNQLRDDNVIRFARSQSGRGGGKFFKLTRPALRENAEAPHGE